MKHGASWVGVWLVLVSCGQELELPVGPEATAGAEQNGPASGITGLGGAADEQEPPARLPVADAPAFGPGGAGGDAGHDSGGGEAGAPVGAGGASYGGGAGKGGGGSAGKSGNGGAGGGQGGEPSEPGVPPQLLFSEYLEGSGSLKALELYASSAGSLEGCDLETYFNGKLEPSRLALHGQVAAGSSYVLCSSALAKVQPDVCSRSTNLTFNGDDALALRCGGVILDVIGQIGLDPGEAWGAGATADHTLRRHCAVTTGRKDGSTPFDPTVEWVVAGPDVFTDLRKHCAPMN